MSELPDYWFRCIDCGATGAFDINTWHGEAYAKCVCGTIYHFRPDLSALEIVKRG